MRYVVASVTLLLVVLSQSFGIDSKFITAEISKMVGDDYQDKCEVLKIVEANNIVAVFVTPPYREFPNVIFFKLIDGNYQRVIEGLTIGIVDAKSDFLNLHTIGQGVDLTIIGSSITYDFKSDDIQKSIKNGITHNSPIVVYQNFIHTHPLRGVKAFYCIDKTKFLNIAQNIFGKEIWQRYPTSGCIMYDLPKMTAMNFEFLQGIYVVTAETNNGQRWRISFTDIDASNEFLSDKEIKVK